jgi:hypothetical protein
MKFSRLALLSCISAPLVLALALPADDLSFHPAANTEVAKTLKLDLEMNVTEASANFNGQELPAEALEQIKQTLIANMVVGVTEKYVETKEGKPLTLLRTFDTMSLDFEFGDNSNADENFKEAEGKTVEFKWNEKEGAYEKSFKDSEGDADELKDLDPDMDLRVLLPEKKVAKGDTWEVAADRLKPLFFPGGMITKVGEEDAEGFDKMRKELEDQFSQFLKDFKVTCTYKGTKDEDGKTAAQIDFTFDEPDRMGDRYHPPQDEARHGLDDRGSDLAAGRRGSPRHGRQGRVRDEPQGRGHSALEPGRRPPGELRHEGRRGPRREHRGARAERRSAGRRQHVGQGRGQDDLGARTEQVNLSGARVRHALSPSPIG